MKLLIVTLAVTGSLVLLSCGHRLSNLKIRNDTKSTLYVHTNEKYFPILPGQTILKRELIKGGINVNVYPDQHPEKRVVIGLFKSDLKCPPGSQGEYCLYIDEEMLKRGKKQ